MALRRVTDRKLPAVINAWESYFAVAPTTELVS